MAEARTSAVVAVVAGGALWGTAGAAQELGVPDAAPATVAAVRSLGGGVLLLLALALAGRAARIRSTLTAAPPALAGGAAALAVFQVAYLTGIRQIGVAIGTLLAIGSAPAWAGLFATLAGRTPSRRWRWATVATVAGATVLLLTGGGLGTGAGSATAGVLAALLAGASYGTYATLSKWLVVAGADGSAAMGWIFTGGGLLLVPVLVLGDAAWLATRPGLLVAAWLTIGTVVIGYQLFARGLTLLDAPEVTTLTLSEPLTAAVLGVALVGERPTVWGIVGALLVAVGLVAVGGRPVQPPH